MQRKCNRPHFILSSVALLILTTLIVGVDAQAQITFVSETKDNADIYVMDADGGNPRKLTRGPRDEWAPSWSPDGKRITFVSQRRDDWGKIYVIDVNGENRRKLTDGPRSEWHPSWSPDGKRIAFVCMDESDAPDIYVMDADGGNPRKLTDNRWLDNFPSWSPDGQRIAFSSKRGADWNKRNGDWDIYVMDADGGNVQNLTNNPLAHDTQPAWYFPAFAVAPAGKTFTMWGWLKQVAR